MINHYKNTKRSTGLIRACLIASAISLVVGYQIGVKTHQQAYMDETSTILYKGKPAHIGEVIDHEARKQIDAYWCNLSKGESITLCEGK